MITSIRQSYRRFISRMSAKSLERDQQGRFIPRRVSVALKMAEAMQRDDLIARLDRG